MVLLSSNWKDVPFHEVIHPIIRNFFQWATTIDSEHRSRQVSVLREALELLFAFSFHSEVIQIFRVSELFDALAALTDISELRFSIVRLFYQCFAVEQEIPPSSVNKCLNIIISAAVSSSEERLMSRFLLARLSFYHQCASEIAHSPLFTTESLRSIIVNDFSSANDEDAILLSLVRNVAEIQPELIRGLEPELLTASIRVQGDDERLADVLSVVNCAVITPESAELLLSSQPLFQRLIDALRNRKCTSQLQLEIVMFIAAVAVTEEIVILSQRFGIMDLLIDLFLGYQDDLEMQTQCLFAFYRLIPYDEPRVRLLRRSEIFPIVARLALSNSSNVSGISYALVDAIELFDKNMALQLRFTMFDAFNAEWMEAIGN
jgi:hypothetical protein